MNPESGTDQLRRISNRSTLTNKTNSTNKRYFLDLNADITTAKTAWRFFIAVRKRFRLDMFLVRYAGLETDGLLLRLRSNSLAYRIRSILLELAKSELYTADRGDFSVSV